MTPTLTLTHDRVAVLASLIVALLAALVALAMVRRMQAHRGAMARAWWVGTALVTGTGIWATHFLGMLAVRAPAGLGFEVLATLQSWLMVILAAGASWATLRPCLGRGSAGHRMRILAAGLMQGLGMSAMHYGGMAALEMSPPIAFDTPRLLLSVLLACVGCCLAFHRLCVQPTPATLAGDRIPALLLASSVGALHYTGMAALQVAEGAVCLSADGLAGAGLGTLILSVTAVMLGAGILLVRLDAQQQAQARSMRASLRSSNEQLQWANTRLKAANDELQGLAFRDALTALPNRVLFEDRLAQALDRLDRRRRGISDETAPIRPLAVLFVDVDGFKPINDSYGHAVGDTVLTEIGQRLKQAVREVDTLARIGGDEFVVLLEDVRDELEALRMAQRLQAALVPPIGVPGRGVQLSCSVGVAVYPGPALPDKLLACADAAMYHAKRKGGAGVALYAAHMDAAAADQVQLQQDLRQALEQGDLQLHYQPKVDGRSGRITGVEALLRWQHPERGTMAPAVFIPLAERFGIIQTIGNWVIEQACSQMRRWESQGLNMRVSINLSAQQLRQRDVMERIREALERHGLDPARLTCEITETVAMEDTHATLDMMLAMQALGVRLSIDDFGTGHSSLSYLRRLPARELKLDRTFVMDLEDSVDARAIADAVLRLAHALGLRVVAEGVETAGQRDLLLRLGCDELQGYLYAPALPGDALLAWARGVHPPTAPDFSDSLLIDRPPL